MRPMNTRARAATPLALADYDPVTSPRKIVDRCMKNRGYEILSDLGKGA